ncbi:Ribonuclease H-like superfamily [Sesbania bispinosa]|nr:Ribonuclease H-like superfamily [Sesbania bispinosa]
MSLERVFPGNLAQGRSLSGTFHGFKIPPYLPMNLRSCIQSIEIPPQSILSDCWAWDLATSRVMHLVDPLFSFWLAYGSSGAGEILLSLVESIEISTQLFRDWQPPTEGFIKLNTDGSCLTINSHLGIGGVIWDTSANWVFGFSGNGGVGVSSFHRYATILAKISDLLRLDWVVQVQHVYREANFGADALAKLGVDQDQAFQIWESPPVAASLALLSDRSGCVHLR